MREGGFLNYNAPNPSNLIVFYQSFNLGTKFYPQIYILYLILLNIHCVQIYFKEIEVIMILSSSNKHVTHKPLR